MKSGLTGTCKTNPHKVQQAPKILHGPGVNCVTLIGADYV